MLLCAPLRFVSLFRTIGRGNKTLVTTVSILALKRKTLCWLKLLDSPWLQQPLTLIVLPWNAMQKSHTDLNLHLCISPLKKIKQKNPQLSFSTRIKL